MANYHIDENTKIGNNDISLKDLINKGYYSSSTLASSDTSYSTSGSDTSFVLKEFELNTTGRPLVVGFFSSIHQTSGAGGVLQVLIDDKYAGELSRPVQNDSNNGSWTRQSAMQIFQCSKGTHTIKINLLVVGRSTLVIPAFTNNNVIAFEI